MDKNEARTLADDIDSALHEMLTARGFALTIKSVKFDPDADGGMTINLQLDKVTLTDNGVNLSSTEALAYRDHCRYGHLFGRRLDPEAVGREVEYGGQTYLFLGLKPRSRTKPWLMMRKNDGQRVVFSESHPAMLACTLAD